MNKTLPILLSILIVFSSLSYAYAFFPLQGEPIIIQNINQTSTNHGTLNQTQANNATINSGAYKLNFINGTGVTTQVVNSAGGKQVNVTISASGVAGVTSLNALAGALTIIGVDGNTTVSTVGGTQIKINTAWQIVTVNGGSQEITKQLTLDTLVLGGQANGNSQSFINLNHVNSTKVFQSGKQVIDTLSGGGSVSISGSGNSRTITGSTYQNNTGSNLGTSGTGIYSGMSGTVLQFLKLISANSNCSISSNSTNVILTCNTGTDTNTAQLASSSPTGYFLNDTNNNATQTTVKSVVAGTGIGLSNATAHHLAISNTGVTSITATSPISRDVATGSVTISCPTCVTSGVTVLANNVTASSTSSYSNIFKIPLTANSGNVVNGIIIAVSNTGGGAVQIGANLTSTHGSGWCNYQTPTSATATTIDNLKLALATADTGETTWLPGANEAQTIVFNCAIDTDGTPPSLWINIQPEVSSTVSAKAGSYYIKSP